MFISYFPRNKFYSINSFAFWRQYNVYLIIGCVLYRFSFAIFVFTQQTASQFLQLSANYFAICECEAENSSPEFCFDLQLQSRISVNTKNTQIAQRSRLMSGKLKKNKKRPNFININFIYMMFYVDFDLFYRYRV